MAVEDGATMAECLSRAQTADQIPKAMQVYERIRKPRAEKLKNLSEASGIDKHYPDGESQRQRDEQMRQSMNTTLAKVPGKGEKNADPFAPVMSHDVVGYVSFVDMFSGLY